MLRWRSIPQVASRALMTQQHQNAAAAPVQAERWIRAVAMLRYDDNVRACASVQATTTTSTTTATASRRGMCSASSSPYAAPAPPSRDPATTATKKQKKGAVMSPKRLLEKKKAGEKITMMTAYDATSARMCEESRLDCILVGDSLGNVIHGSKHTRAVTVDDIIYHLRCVTPQVTSSLIVGDMPFGSYEISPEQAVATAIRLVKEGGATAVKLEGPYVDQVKAIVKAGIPVVAHIGLQPQTSSLMTGSYGASGVTADEGVVLLKQALDLQSAGACCVVLECVAAPIASYITSQLTVPSIGIGAGGGCSGQVLVYHDVLGFNPQFKPRFVHRFAELAPIAVEALNTYRTHVESGVFPSDQHSFSIADTEWEAFQTRVMQHQTDDTMLSQQQREALAHASTFNPRRNMLPKEKKNADETSTPTSTTASAENTKSGGGVGVGVGGGAAMDATTTTPTQTSTTTPTTAAFPIGFSASPPLRVAVVGGGSLGSLMAATLATHAHGTVEPIVEVTLVSRWEAHRQAIGQHGLRVLSSDGSLIAAPLVHTLDYPTTTTTNAHVTQNAAAAGGGVDVVPKFDVVIVCVKTNDTHAAGVSSALLLREGGVCLTMQNGLGNTEVLRSCIPPTSSIGQGVTSAGAALQGPGCVRKMGHGKTEVAIFSCGKHDRSLTCDASMCDCGGYELVSRVARALVGRGMPCDMSGDATATLWRKLSVSCGVNPVTALLRLTNGDVAEAEPAARVVALAAAEAANVARKYGVEIDPDCAARDAVGVARDTGPNTSSMLSDLLQHQPTEIDAINRAVVDAGRAVGMPCPVNAALADLVSAAAVTWPRRIPEVLSRVGGRSAGAAAVPLNLIQQFGASTTSTTPTTPTPTPNKITILRTVDNVREWVASERAKGNKIGFVPTMGYLHQGHLSLVRTAIDEINDNNAHSASVIASIFVNPKQFAAHEDLGTYPRDTEGDIAKLQSVGCKAVWIPEVEEMYPKGFSTKVMVEGPLTERLCSVSRPHFFGGVATVVLKLLMCVMPDVAVFGEKDYQQLLVIRRMVKDLCVPVRVASGKTVRESDGLAMSSRNARLSKEARKAAPALHRALVAAREAHVRQTASSSGGGGVYDGSKVKQAAVQVLEAQEGVEEIDYVDVLDAETLEVLDGGCGVEGGRNGVVVAMAVKVGGVRLIDNVVLG